MRPTMKADTSPNVAQVKGAHYESRLPEALG